MSIESGADLSKPGNIDSLLEEITNLNLHDIDPELLQTAEFSQIQWVLDQMSNKTIKDAYVENNRIVIETSDGNRFFFFGFMGLSNQK